MWTGASTAVPWQISAPLLCDAVLLTSGQQVAQVWGAPRARLAVEMVFRAFSHSSRAGPRGERDARGGCLAEPAQLLGLVKRQRPQHRERQERASMIGGGPEVVTGARDRRTARHVHTRSVSAAARAGDRRRHVLAAPVP